MSGEPNPARTVAGVFLLVAGICLVLLGGGCTIGVLGNRHPGGGELDLTGLILTIALLMVAIGALMVWGGVRLLKPRDE
jgi:uncharacterized protein HemY